MISETRYLRNAHVVWNVVDDEVVVLDTIEGFYFGLNPTAAAVWQILDEPKTVREISDHLQDHFSGISAQNVMEDTIDLLENLISRHLITTIE